MSVILKADHICVAYEGKKVVDHVSFEVEHGDYLCIVGENGTGKSSLVKAMLGLVPTCCGKAVFNLKNGKKRIGYLPQQTLLQKDFPASVGETVISGCLSGMRFPKIYRKAEKELAETYMKYLDIYELRHKATRDLSGGQRQRVLLARALCAADEILVLDEPVSGLDTNAARDLYSCLEKLNREKNITVIMISHDMNSAMKYATKILHLDTKLLFFGKKEDYLFSIHSKKLLS
ncbi:MAG: ATP-binding cassette domain-containing protein [Clostridia bacterium]|nr:ATP-binding cassette domain-containing protein [Clostridia bacterium]